MINPVRVEYRYVNASGDSIYSSEPSEDTTVPADLVLDQDTEK